MLDTSLIVWSLLTGVMSALATGLGAPLVALVPMGSDRIRAFASAVAAGMMISASVFSLAQEGMEMQVAGATLKVIGGLLLGTWVLWFLSERLGDQEELLSDLELSTSSLFLFVALVIHSTPEGIAIGVGFATGDVEFGLVMAIAISIHNIPEGIAMSLPMRAEGESIAKCAWISVLTSVPQPVFAVPSALGFYYVQPWLPLGLGFAGGAMIFVTVVELLPESLEFGDETVTAWGVMIGLSGMLAITALLPGS